MRFVSLGVLTFLFLIKILIGGQPSLSGSHLGGSRRWADRWLFREFFDSWWPLLKSRFLSLSSSLTGGVASAKDEGGSIGYASEDD